MSHKPARPAVFVLATLAVAACSGGAAGPTATVSPVATGAPATAAATIAPSVVPPPSVAPMPTVFTSLVYGYSLTVPAGWSIGPAMLAWDGTSGVGHDDPFVDKFAGPESESFFAFAKPYTGTLEAFAKEEIDATARFHADTCPHPLDSREPIRIAGGPGVFLAWNCGILINQAVTVHAGTAWAMVARDTEVQAATNAADRALFDQLLGSLTFTR